MGNDFFDDVFVFVGGCQSDDLLVKIVFIEPGGVKFPAVVDAGFFDLHVRQIHEV